MRVVLLWKEVDSVKLLSLSPNYIDVEVHTEGFQWRLTRFYGEPDRNLRQRTWDLLRNLARDSNLPWCVIGDMNNIVSQEEKRGGAAYPQRLIDGFNKALEDAELKDLDLYGHPFTWERGRDTEAWIEIRLDRALVTNAWWGKFPLTKLFNLEVTPSDQSPILLNPKSICLQHFKRQFRFENAWLLEPLCSQIVKDNWEADISLNVMQKIALCGESLEV